MISVAGRNRGARLNHPDDHYARGLAVNRRSNLRRNLRIIAGRLQVSCSLFLWRGRFLEDAFDLLSELVDYVVIGLMAMLSCARKPVRSKSKPIRLTSA